jgi:hypothetical protein
MGLQHRQAIFEMRSRVDPETGKLFTLEKIGTTLGISKSLVNKELRRPASKTESDDSDPSGELYTPPVHVPSGPIGDPEVDEARKRYELERVSVATAELRARRLESERRLELLGKSQTGDSGALMLVIEGLRDLRTELASNLRRPPAGPPPPPPPTELDILERWQRTNQVMQQLAPAKPPTTAAELELQVAKDKLDLEREERMRRLDADLEERRRQLDNERIRSEAIAEQIRTWGPLIAQGFQTWLNRQGEPGNGSASPAAADSSGVGPRPGLTVLTPEHGPGMTVGMVEGPCPSCGASLGIVGTQVEICPRCKSEVVVVEGRIHPKYPESRANYFAS